VRICVTDELGDPLPTAEVHLAWRDGDCWRYPEQLCAGVSAPGFLDAELCPESPGHAWLRSDYALALERGVVVAVRCDDGPGGTRCPDRVGILQCVSDSTPDVGHCLGEPLTCTCPDAPDAAVLAQGGPYAGERAPVRGGVATLRHTGTPSLTVASTDYCGALLLRDERDGQVLIGKLKCEDGAPKRGRLVAGQYVVMSMGADGTQTWSGIDIADGEQERVDLAVPPSQPVEVEWAAGPPAQVFTTVALGDYQASSTGSPSLPVQVPAGATLWVCAGDGCCRYQDPGERVSCDPNPGVSPPIPQIRL